MFDFAFELFTVLGRFLIGDHPICLALSFALASQNVERFGQHPHFVSVAILFLSEPVGPLFLFLLSPLSTLPQPPIPFLSHP